MVPADERLSKHSAPWLDVTRFLAASWPSFGVTLKCPVTKPKKLTKLHYILRHMSCDIQTQNALTFLDNSLGLRALSAALCSRCLWRMIAAFLWFVQVSGSAIISVIFRLFLMAWEAVERASVGSISWYFWSVKSNSGLWTSSLILNERVVIFGFVLHCYPSTITKWERNRVNVILYTCIIYLRFVKMVYIASTNSSAAPGLQWMVPSTTFFIKCRFSFCKDCENIFRLKIISRGKVLSTATTGLDYFSSFDI